MKYIKHARPSLNAFPNTHEKSFENKTRTNAFLTNFEVLGMRLNTALCATSSDSKTSGLTFHKLSDSLRIYFFHSGERIQNFPDLLPHSPNVRGRKPYPERKIGGFKKIRIRAHPTGPKS